MPTDISSPAIITISINKDYVRKTPLTIDAKPLNYNALFTDRRGNNSLSSTLINTQEILNGTRNLTQQDIQISSHFVYEEMVETISPIHPTLTNPKNKKKHFRKQLYNPQ